ncbi:ATP-binding protein [Streptomyces sp. DSM 41534]
MRPTDAGNRFPGVLLPGVEQRAHAVQPDALRRASFGLRKPGEVETLRRFMGRDREIAQFRAAAATPGVLCVHGPGGVGKRALLDVLADVAEREGIFTVRVDCRDMPPLPDALPDTDLHRRFTAGMLLRIRATPNEHQRLKWSRTRPCPVPPGRGSRHAPYAARALSGRTGRPRSTAPRRAPACGSWLCGPPPSPTRSRRPARGMPPRWLRRVHRCRRWRDPPAFSRPQPRGTGQPGLAPAPCWWKGCHEAVAAWRARPRAG